MWLIVSSGSSGCCELGECGVSLNQRGISSTREPLDCLECSCKILSLSNEEEGKSRSRLARIVEAALAG